MKANVLPFARRPAYPQGWSASDLGEFHRISALLRRTGLSIEVESGLSDEGDPWLIILREDTDDVIAHFARIDGRVIASSVTSDHVLRGRELRPLLEMIVRTQPLVLPATDTGSRLLLHPTAALAAFIATAYVYSVNAASVPTLDLSVGHEGQKADADGTKRGEATATGSLLRAVLTSFQEFAARTVGSDAGATMTTAVQTAAVAAVVLALALSTETTDEMATKPLSVSQAFDTPSDLAGSSFDVSLPSHAESQTYDVTPEIKSDFNSPAQQPAIFVKSERSSIESAVTNPDLRHAPEALSLGDRAKDATVSWDAPANASWDGLVGSLDGAPSALIGARGVSSPTAPVVTVSQSQNQAPVTPATRETVSSAGPGAEAAKDRAELGASSPTTSTAPGADFDSKSDFVAVARTHSLASTQFRISWTEMTPEAMKILGFDLGRMALPADPSAAETAPGGRLQGVDVPRVSIATNQASGTSHLAREGDTLSVKDATSLGDRPDDRGPINRPAADTPSGKPGDPDVAAAASITRFVIEGRSLDPVASIDIKIENMLAVSRTTAHVQKILVYSSDQIHVSSFELLPGVVMVHAAAIGFSDNGPVKNVDLSNGIHISLVGIVDAATTQTKLPLDLPLL
jgi:hypothetical protein